MSAMEGSRQQAVTFFTSDVRGSFIMELELAAGVFDPADPWATTFREALARADFAGGTVVELGAGSGASAVQACRTSTPRRVVLNDLVPEFAALAARNLTRSCGDRLCTYGVELITRPGDAVECLRQLADEGIKADFIIGCLPQVPTHSHAELADRAAVAHLYDRERHPRDHKWGLGLIADAKLAAREVLMPDGRLLFVHSGRVPTRIRRAMDDAVGFHETRIVHQAMVLHHSGTPLTYLFGEDGNLLFADQEGRQGITPEQAEECRVAFAGGRIGQAEYRVFHWVYVVESELIH